MGRKVEMKKIEDVTRCQVTYSKRRSSLMKKAHEISVCCDVDVAFIAFSPSGRLSKFCSQNRIEDVLERYINLSAERRYCHIKNLEEKQERLKQLQHIKGDRNKLIHLNNQAEQTQLQITKAKLELQMVESSLRDFEPAAEQGSSLAQLLWCERNLKDSLKRVVNKKKLLLGSFQSSLGQSNNFQMYYQAGIGETQNGTSSITNDISGKVQNPCANHLLLQLDPWISPYSARVRESILQNLRSQANETPISKTLSPPAYNTPLQGMPGNDAPSWVQQLPAQTIGSYGDSQNRKDNDAPINIRSDSSVRMETNWFTGTDEIPCHNLNAFIQSNNHYWNATEQPQSVLVQADLPQQESAEGSVLPKDTSIEAVTGNSTLWAGGAPEGCSSWGWEGPEGFVLPENLNFEDFDMPL